ncbi:uncharacterized protein [Physcomitrium patens]|uniref:Uncharacterized protein n=1 Tax=Physcomitrium patens TaxID=3218 RepID=A0A2K1K3K2_PHYPA|nr:uncharacterized protein LOC112286794 [Physcomitrium patens]PNR48356.1 hypothetical protein PHYPA_012832 [Physcomitrium patens]|eukprot:XP_024384833.1 uncharacterized protein LOC112286794 [Physcomitrella patens]
MTQKGGLFKGQKKKTAAPNRHGKEIHIRKGRQFKPSAKKEKNLDGQEEVTKFINAANETKAATAAAKEGAQLRLVKPPEGVSKSAPSAKRPSRKLSKK